METTKLGIMGPSGRMGKSLITVSKEFKNLQVVSLCDHKDSEIIGKIIDGIEVLSDLEIFLQNVDVVIDFTTPNATLELLKQLSNKKLVGLVTGTTGYDENQVAKFNSYSKGLKVLKASNMSYGINLLQKICEELSSKIGADADIEILETHHKHKLDAPSGTALSIGNAIKKGRDKIEKSKFIYRGIDFNKKRDKGDIGFSAIRGGDIIGDHSVHFFLNGERLEISHKATDRKVFSIGALRAAEWLKKQEPGLYSLADMV